MTELKIKAESDKVAEATKAFILNYKETFCQFVNMFISEDGTPVDSAVEEIDGVVQVWQLAPDKGFVLGETGDEALPIQLQQYKTLPVGHRYVMQTNEHMALFWKRPEGVADIRLGNFKNLNDVIKAFNSPEVLTQLEKAKDWEKARDKDIKRLKKLGKIDDAQVVAEEAPVNE